MTVVGQTTKAPLKGRTSPVSRLRSIISEMGSVLIAFSGGVDSSFLLRFASEVLGKEAVWAVTVDTPLLPDGEIREALALAKQWDVRIRTVEMDPLTAPEVARNTPERCYVCKTMIFSRLVSMAREMEIPWVLEGTNADDITGYRPGIRALEELGIRSPLREAGLGKDEIRAESRVLGISTWNRPSSPCLATRFPYGDLLAPELLRKVDEGERLLKGLGFETVRLRVHGGVARIEVPPERLGELLSEKVSGKVISYLRDKGFSFVTLDLEGFRSGSMDQKITSG